MSHTAGPLKIQTYDDDCSDGNRVGELGDTKPSRVIPKMIAPFPTLLRNSPTHSPECGTFRQCCNIFNAKLGDPSRSSLPPSFAVCQSTEIFAWGG